MLYGVIVRADGGVSLFPLGDGDGEDVFEAWKLTARSEWLPATLHTSDQELSESELAFHGSRMSVGSKGQPADNALVWDGSSVVCDMLRARAIHMDAIRRCRNKELDLNDKDFTRAQGRKDQAVMDAVEAERERLRQIPQTFDLSSATTPEALIGLWPPGLPREG